MGGGEIFRLSCCRGLGLQGVGLLGEFLGEVGRFIDAGL